MKTENVVALSFRHHQAANKIPTVQQMNRVSIDSAEAHAIADLMLSARSKIIAQRAVVCQDTKEIRISCAEQLVAEAILSAIQDVLVSMETALILVSLIIHAD